MKTPRVTDFDPNAKVYIDNLTDGAVTIDGKVQQITVPKPTSSVNVNTIIGLVGKGLVGNIPLLIDGRPHIHWLVSPAPGKDQALILDPASNAYNLIQHHF